MERLLKGFERTIVLSLVGLMMVTVLVATIELAVTLYRKLMQPPVYLLDIQEMQEVLGFFLMVLIGLELLGSIKTYLVQDRVHAEVVFLVAIVAVVRKVIILDHRDMAPGSLYGIAAIIVALGAGYYLMRRALQLRQGDSDPAQSD